MDGLCERAGATLGIDNISLMQGCAGRGHVMDPTPLTHHGYAGLESCCKKKKMKKVSEWRLRGGSGEGWG